jgi:hypothetical protein
VFSYATFDRRFPISCHYYHDHDRTHYQGRGKQRLAGPTKGFTAMTVLTHCAKACASTCSADQQLVTVLRTEVSGSVVMVVVVETVAVIVIIADYLLLLVLLIHYLLHSYHIFSCLLLLVYHV